jgi:DNA-binding beta-propeller fold protein YncE
MNSTLYHLPPGGWGIVWGGTGYETATGIAIDDDAKYVYVSGYSDSVGSLSIAKEDMFILKISVATNLLTWAKRFGSTSIDRAHGVTWYNDYVYLVGESDSPGWTSAKTDMIVL